jgi:NADH-quinone oxidoreductase subunit N
MPLDSLLPELLLVLTIASALLAHRLPDVKFIHAGWLALAGVVLILIVAGSDFAREETPEARILFGGMLLQDRLTVFFRLFLVACAGLTILLALTSGLVKREDSAIFCTLILGATLGLMLMTQACHLLMLIVALEVASLPGYALVAWQRQDRQAGEAALKYALYGAGATAVMLYGASLLAGHYGTGSLPDLAAGIALTIRASGMLPPIALLGLLFVLVGVAYKLAAVPFHVWCPDAYEGATAEVAGFLSVSSKAAAVAVLARIAFLLAGLDPIAEGVPAEAWNAVTVWLLPSLAIFGAVTCTFGNLAAFWQMNAQRLLAYSAIAHAGFLMMGVAALTRESLSAVLVYLVAFLFANLGAFAVLAFVRRQLGSSDLRDLRGLVRRSPVMTVTLALFVLSLLGIPPLIGFFAKVDLFLALFHAGQAHPTQAGWLYGLLTVAAVNAILAAVYYLGMLRVLILEQRVEDLEGNPPQALTEPPVAVAYTGVLAVLVVGLIVVADPVVGASQKGADRYAATAGERPGP